MTKASVLGCRSVQKGVTEEEGDRMDGDGGLGGQGGERTGFTPPCPAHICLSLLQWKQVRVFVGQVSKPTKDAPTWGRVGAAFILGCATQGCT